MARLSYDNSGVALQGSARHVCIAVSFNGDYRMVRSLDGDQTQRLHGRMTEEVFRQLSALLAAPDFRDLSGYHGGLVRQEAQSFAAVIPLSARRHEDGTGKWLEQGAWRFQWLNGDGQSPFPASVSKVVN